MGQTFGRYQGREDRRHRGVGSRPGLAHDVRVGDAAEVFHQPRAGDQARHYRPGRDRLVLTDRRAGSPDQNGGQRARNRHAQGADQARRPRPAVSGKPHWKRAFGYLPDTRAKDEDDGTRQIDPHAQALVARGYRAVLAGSSISDVARMLNNAGAHGLNGRPWTASTVSLFLRKPRNAGLRDHNDRLVRDEKGRPVKGTWPPTAARRRRSQRAGLGKHRLTAAVTITKGLRNINVRWRGFDFDDVLEMRFEDGERIVLDFDPATYSCAKEESPNARQYGRNPPPTCDFRRRCTACAARSTFALNGLSMCSKLTQCAGCCRSISLVQVSHISPGNRWCESRFQCRRRTSRPRSSTALTASCDSPTTVSSVPTLLHASLSVAPKPFSPRPSVAD